MLPRAVRMRTADDFAGTVRRGVRVGRATLVVHVSGPVIEGDTRVGFVVSKAVGNAVTRNRVKRRLRHLSRNLLVHTPPGVQVVVRALPAAAADHAAMPADLQGAWLRALGRLAERNRRTASAAAR